DITHAPPNEIAAMGIAQLPGGDAVFPSMTVTENLEAAEWLHPEHPMMSRAEVLELFPALTMRLDEPAANLSGGQQQMLAFAMVLLGSPRVLLIDELSLGLAPAVVEELLPVVQRVADAGVSVILVEQSVNVALTIAERAYFMEKGQIRFSGPTADLLDRPDILRSVFLQGAAAATEPVREGVAREDRGPDGQADGSADSSEEAGSAESGRSPAIDRSQPPILRVHDLTRSFGGIRAVDGVALEVYDREIVGVIGPNGAGKTTMFDLISGFLPADTGEIELEGRPLDGLSAHQRAAAGLGRSFQDARLFPALTVAETLAVALERFIPTRDPVSAALHLPNAYDSEQKTKQRVAELIELMALGDYRNKFIRELSTGTRRMVDLACVVAHRPLVVLLDEPSSGIAQREAEALAPVLRRIRSDMGAALVVIEHDMPLLRSVADRFVALDQGSVLSEGRPDEVLEDPNVVASYLGTTEAVIARSGPAT
ncbi:MAG: ATP-binding cassette domain-containing protein, partial [Acidimicrobiales bacterium]|nr:ATP-binding cassette domain-containing protein [Acidimicrobiales bacterium]